MRRLHLAALSALLVLGSAAHAHGGTPHAKERSGPIVKEQLPWGVAGDPAAATRTIVVEMGDDMRFTPDRVTVEEGETIRFVARNKGAVMHELVIGTPEVLAEHAEMMARFPDMEHDEPYMAHVAPGEAGEIVWTFNRAGEFDFACLLPGHFQAGMVGSIDVDPRRLAQTDREARQN